MEPFACAVQQNSGVKINSGPIQLRLFAQREQFILALT